jgi:hypothetical protein
VMHTDNDLHLQLPLGIEYRIGQARGSIRNGQALEAGNGSRRSGSRLLGRPVLPSMNRRSENVDEFHACGLVAVQGPRDREQIRIAHY